VFFRIQFQLAKVGKRGIFGKVEGAEITMSNGESPGFFRCFGRLSLMGTGP
jgi:hypothetical protein